MYDNGTSTLGRQPCHYDRGGVCSRLVFYNNLYEAGPELSDPVLPHLRARRIHLLCDATTNGRRGRCGSTPLWQGAKRQPKQTPKLHFFFVVIVVIVIAELVIVIFVLVIVISSSLFRHRHFIIVIVISLSSSSCYHRHLVFILFPFHDSLFF